MSARTSAWFPRRTAVERGRVVGFDRTEVAAAVDIYRNQSVNRESSGIEAPKHRDDVGRGVAVDDGGAGVRTSVEPEIGHLNATKIAKRDGAVRVPRDAGHALRERRVDR
jgi:hypothetical protein